MRLLDFYRSYIVFEMDFEAHPPETVSDQRQSPHNRARIRIDCRCQVTEPSGATTDYYLGEATKTERVGADRDLGIFTQPNADFRPIMSENYSILLKSWDTNDKGVMLDPPSLGPQPERQVIKTADAFHEHRFDLNETEAGELGTIGRIMEAADSGAPIVARTEYESFGYRIVLDYPVKTMNVGERPPSYQTDTGPVIFADLSGTPDPVVEGFWLAFCAFNSSDWVEFIVQRPTPVGQGISASHYSEPAFVDGSRNTLYATE